jgi:hypothetical protein
MIHQDIDKDPAPWLFFSRHKLRSARLPFILSFLVRPFHFPYMMDATPFV